MFVYEKKLQYPVKVATPNPKLAAVIISQYGGPDGELGASLRYLSQRYSMPYPELKGLLTDIGTEELGHLEMIGTLVHQLTRNLTEEALARSSRISRTIRPKWRSRCGFRRSDALSGMQVAGRPYKAARFFADAGIFAYICDSVCGRGFPADPSVEMTL